jgi:N-acetylneuraminic acid mutarotase
MIVWGGENAIGTPTFDGGLYDPVTNTWTAMNRSGAPWPRSNHVAVWTGTKMIVWGGFGSWDQAQQARDIRHDGGAYDPRTDAWTPVTARDAPPLWVNYTAVWTGTKMLLWGGVLRSSEGSTAVNFGRIYDPATDTWTAMSVDGAPDPMSAHVPVWTAVWTGSQMIVWGAASSNGGAYDPARDSWAPLERHGAPPNRQEASAVWAGSSMLLWGGRWTNPGVSHPEPCTNRGGAYDPAANAWSPLGTRGAPEPRSYHSAVWTGRAMIVWGGTDFWSRFGNGGIYDPLTGTWQATSTVGAPLGRMSHTAVWTGSQMIVWGGVKDPPGVDYGVENTGGVYDPATDTWTPTATTAPPRQ